MSNMECPFCQQKLECCAAYICGTRKLGCANCGVTGDSKLFDEIIRTRKALEIAVVALKRIKEPTAWGTLYQEQEIADQALEQITALEQKDK